MKVKDLVKGKAYKVFDYKHCPSSSIRSDNMYVSAVYFGRMNGCHWFVLINDCDCCCYLTDEIHSGHVEEVEENERV